MKKVVVIAGGKSQEREVSLLSGKEVFAALEEAGYSCSFWDPKVDTVQDLLQFQPDVAFIALHGPYGEDGCIQGFLETLEIPYTGSGVAASALGMNKQLTKKLLAYEGLPTPAFLLTNQTEAVEETILHTRETLGFPVIVKAADQGSSIGTFFVEQEPDMANVLRQVYAYDSEIVIEQYIRGMELTVAIMGNPKNPIVLPIIEIDYTQNTLWDYQSKYTPGLFRHIIPARISKTLEEKVRQLTIDTYRLFGCSGFARVDFMVDAQENPYILEINTIPGCTATSLFPDAARAAGISFVELIRQLVENV